MKKVILISAVAFSVILAALLLSGILKINIAVNINDNQVGTNDTLFISNDGDIICINTIESDGVANIEKIAYNKAIEKVINKIDNLDKYCKPNLHRQINYERISSKVFANSDSTQFACRVGIVVHQQVQ